MDMPTAADRDDSGLVVQHEFGACGRAAQSSTWCRGLNRLLEKVTWRRIVKLIIFLSYSAVLRTLNGVAYVPAQQNPQTKEYGVRYQTRSYSRAVAQTNTENEKSLESNKTAQGTV